MRKSKQILQEAVPPMLGGVLYQAIDVINLYYICSTKDADKIAGYGLINAFINIFGVSILLSINKTLERSLETASRDKYGVVIWRGRLIGFVAAIIVVFLLYFSQGIVK